MKIAAPNQPECVRAPSSADGPALRRSIAGFALLNARALLPAELLGGRLGACFDEGACDPRSNGLQLPQRNPRRFVTRKKNFCTKRQEIGGGNSSAMMPDGEERSGGPGGN